MKTETRHLAVPLTDHELAGKSEDLARANIALNAAEANKKLVNKQLTGEVDQKKADVTLLSQVVSSKSEVRPVQCGWFMNSPKVGRKELQRLDTGEVVETRDMVGDDMQTEMHAVVRQAESQGKKKPEEKQVRDVEGKVIDLVDVEGKVIDLVLLPAPNKPLALPAPKQEKKGKKPAKDKPAKDKPKKKVVDPLALAKAIITDPTTPGHLKWKKGDKAIVEKVKGLIEDARAKAGEDEKAFLAIGEIETLMRKHLEELDNKKKK